MAQKLELREKSGFSIYEKVDPSTGNSSRIKEKEKNDIKKARKKENNNNDNNKNKNIKCYCTN